MDERSSGQNRPSSPRRKPRSKLQVFKEAYLPLLIVAAAILLIIVFVAGSISRAVDKKKAAQQASIAASSSEAARLQMLEQEARQLVTSSELLAEQYDYVAAIDLLDTFSGNISDFPVIADKRDEYVRAQAQMVAWEDPSQVLSLCFQLLVADAGRTFNHPTYATLFNRSFITVEEFSRMLLDLYENGYILVMMDDFIDTQYSEDGTVSYVPKTLYLPQGKKPLMLTQINVNYNIYLIDGNGDRLPDKDGGGFASCMFVDENGEISCQMVDSNGEIVTGDLDLVPILNSFLESHPDFSYKGAKALLALTGYNGLFGHRTNKENKEFFGEDAYNTAVDNATKVANALLADGYEFACYTYENIGYGEKGTAEIGADLQRWKEEVLPILGEVDTLVFAQNSDIDSGTGAYSGDKFTLLRNNGFSKFIGYCTDGTSWASLNGDYLRMGRVMVTGSTVAHNADWFEGVFDAKNILDSSRGNVPK